MIKSWLQRTASATAETVMGAASATADTVKGAAAATAETVELVKIGTSLQALASSGNVQRWKNLAESLAARTGQVATSDAPEALKKIFDPANLTTMWDLATRIFAAVVSLRSTLKANPQVAEPLKDVLSGIRALRAVQTADDAERCVRDLQDKLKKAETLIPEDAVLVRSALRTSIDGFAGTLSTGFRWTPNFLVGMAMESVDTQLLVLEMVLSFCLE